MRIMAIRGHNLASLAEPFAIDFETDPIRTSGIFAIVGPTGAGKSTLLDAMCLALFDQLPRLEHADKKAQIGRDGDADLQSYDDVRNVLRHGASEAFAEVDFVGQNGAAYRARWQLRRARGRKDGKLQGQTVSLIDLSSGQPIGDKKTDVLEEIRLRIGLNFQQFRRSVLLPQGEFDTFIKADAKARAELLERITGTAIYAELSKASHERRKSEQQALASLEERLSEVRPLTPDERHAAVQNEHAARQALDEIVQRREDVRRAGEWHVAARTLQVRLNDANAAAERARQDDLEQAPAKAALKEAEQAFAVRAELSDATQRLLEVGAAQAALRDAEAACVLATALHRQATEAKMVGEAALRQCREERTKLAPSLQIARSLEASLVRISGDLTEKAAERDWRASLAVDAEAEQRRATDARAEAQALIARHRTWLNAHAALAHLVPRIDEVVSDLAKLNDLENDLVEIERQRTMLASERAALIIGLSNAKAELQQSDEGLRVLEKSRLPLRGEFNATKRAAIQQSLDLARTAGRVLQSRHEAMVSVNAMLAALRQIDEREAAAAAALKAAEGEHDRVGRDLPPASARLAEARRGAELSDAAASDYAEHLRGLLVEGEPCPVCGVAHQGAAVQDERWQARAASDRERVVALQRVVDELRRVGAVSQATLENCKSVREDLDQRRDAATAEHDRANDRVVQLTAELTQQLRSLQIKLPDEADDRALGRAIEAAFADAHERSERLLRVEAELTTLEGDLARVGAAQERQRAEIEALDIQQQRLVLDDAKLQERHDAVTRDHGSRIERLAIILAPAFPDWRSRIGDLRLAELCRERATAWTTCTAAVERLSGELADWEGKLRSARTLLAERQSALAKANADHARAERDAGNVTAELQRLFDGRPAVLVERELAEAVERTERRLAAITRTAEETGAGQAAAAAASTEAERTLVARKAASARSEQALSAALAARGLNREAVEQVVARGEPWLDDERARLDRLRQALAEAVARQEACTHAVDSHAANGQPALAALEIEQLAADLEQQHAAADFASRESWAVLQSDDRIIKLQALRLAELAERRAQADVWLRLADLIGSADGAKFRRFAQNLTLVQLLHLANLHLADLNPRYELQRAPGGDLVLQVIDRDMADEVRGVHSLSGGERFLISLALALGLASLSAGQGIRVESLFIDEGFGALDGQSLNLAISALERLQATGRQVGVISHVDELKDRISVKVEVTPCGGGRSTVAVLAS